MVKGEIERTVELSVFDRLLDEDPGTTAERAMSRAESIERLKESVRRDLEWLLNTRRTPETAPDTLEQLQRSLYHYGLPDVSSMSRDSPEVRNRLARLVEQAITAHEPRLDGVRVALAGGEKTAIGAVRFVVEAMLRMDPSPERVSFDTVLATGSGSVVVMGGGDA
ncbi:MAG TPA: type VI secretion system baseplate subunit TssE [Gemmatimonadales bacterium]|nr:type VI secretion system baseplate subunit TssE [Gemmatimonadales bacterium]